MAGTELLTNRLCVTAEYKQKPTKYVWGPGGDSRTSAAEMRRRL